jgi:hypothetical protein
MDHAVGMRHSTSCSEGHHEAGARSHMAPLFTELECSTLHHGSTGVGVLLYTTH